MKDRISTHPGRVKITPESGTPYYATLERADDPTEVGTALNKANLLTDATAALIAALTGTTPDTPNEALAQLLNGITANVYNGVDSTSATKAASANAVKTAYDLASKKLLVTETGTYAGADALTKDITVTEIPDYLVIVPDSDSTTYNSIAPIIVPVGGSAKTIGTTAMAVSGHYEWAFGAGYITCAVQGANTLHLAGNGLGGVVRSDYSATSASWVSAPYVLTANARNITYRYYCLKDGNAA